MPLTLFSSAKGGDYRDYSGSRLRARCVGVGFDGGEIAENRSVGADIHAWPDPESSHGRNALSL